MRARAHIGGGARDGAGDAEAAEQRGADIGHALRHQFAVGAVAAARHAVRHDGGEQRLDGAQQREGNGGGQHRERPSPTTGQAATAPEGRSGMPPNLEPMVATGRPSNAVAAAASATAISMPGQCGRSAFEAQYDARRAERQRQGRGRERRQRLPQHGQFLEQRPGLRPGERQPQKLPDLAGEDDDGDPRGEAHRHRKGNELDEGAEPEEADERQQDAGDEGGEDQPVHAVLGNGCRPPAR